MLIFHEGLPGSGKSYEAIAKHIIAALQKARHVYTNIRGVDAVQIAAFLGVDRDSLVSLLHVCDSKDKAELTAFFMAALPDSLIVWDEIQDFYPAQRQPLDKPITEWVTQHRHSGIDIVLLGQDRRDVHNIFRRRIERVIHFRKMNAVGLDNRYIWTLSQAQGLDKYKKVSSGQGTYEPAICDCYQSVRAETENLASYGDSRANILKQKSLLLVPVVLLAAAYGVWWVFTQFFGQGMVDSTPAPVAPAQTAPAAAPVASPGHKLSEVALTAPVPQAADRIHSEKLAWLFDNYKARLEGLLVDGNDPNRWFASVVFYDDSFRARERFSKKQIEAFGVIVTRHDYGLTLMDHGTRYDVTLSLDPLSQPVDYKSADAGGMADGAP